VSLRCKPTHSAFTNKNGMTHEFSYAAGKKSQTRRRNSVIAIWYLAKGRVANSIKRLPIPTVRVSMYHLRNAGFHRLFDPLVGWGNRCWGIDTYLAGGLDECGQDDHGVYILDFVHTTQSASGTNWTGMPICFASHAHLESGASELIRRRTALSTSEK
jgi:hypothetical protein